MLKKLVFITRPINPPWNEGSKNFTFDLAREIHVSNLKICLLTTKESVTPLPPDVLQIPIYSSSKLNFFTKLRLLFFLIKTDADLAHFIFAVKPLTSVVIKLILFLKQIKSVQTIVSLDSNASPLMLRLTLYGNPIVCLSKTTTEKIKKAGLSNVQTILPSVNTKIFKPSEKKNKIAFLGELYRMESYDIVSKLIPLLNSAFPNYSIILGFRFSNKLPQEFRLREKLRKQTQEAKSNVEWRDVIENMPEFLKDTKLVVFPATLMRGKFDFPLVLIESLACGTPIIVSPIDSLLELARYKGAMIPDKNTPVAFEEKIKETLNGTSYDNLSKLARESALNHFSIQKSARKYEEIYGKLIKN